MTNSQKRLLEKVIEAISTRYEGKERPQVPGLGVIQETEIDMLQQQFFRFSSEIDRLNTLLNQTVSDLKAIQN